jgi:hypothetical protein
MRMRGEEPVGCEGEEPPWILKTWTTARRGREFMWGAEGRYGAGGVPTL